MLLFYFISILLSDSSINVRKRSFIYQINKIHLILFQINRLLIGHTNEGMRAGWFLDSVQIMVPVHGKHYMFPSHRWLDEDEADSKTEVEIYPSEILDMEQRRQQSHTLTEDS